MNKTKKSTIEVIKEHFSYPMLLLAIVSLFKIKSILSSFISIFLMLFKNPGLILNAVLGFVLIVTPLVILFLLWLHRNKNYEKAKTIIAVILGVVTLIKIYDFVVFLVHILPQTTFDIDFVVHNLPSLLSNIFDILLYSILAINLLLNRKKYTVYYIVSVIYIIETLFFGILVSVIGVGSLLSASLSVLNIIALWYIPEALDNSNGAEITKGKGKALAAIACIVMIVFFSNAGETGQFSSSNNNISKNSCGSCGRSYNAGDPNGDYMNIAKTGLCKNCDNNRKSLEWVLD